MTPTLLGRWQTRLFLLGTVGVLITLLFGAVIGNLAIPFAVLGYVLVFGFVWDGLYNVLQTFRWDHDWPPVLQLAAGVAEGIVLWLLIRLIGLPATDGLTLGQFLVHYSLVWLFTFLFSQGPMRILFPRWRLYGGQWL